MSEESSRAAQMLRRMFGAIDACEWHLLPDCFTAGVVYERPGYAPINGIAELMHFYRAVRIIARGEHRIAQIVASGTHAACWGDFRGTGRDGSALNERFADVYTLQDGRVAHRCTHFFRPAI